MQQVSKKIFSQLSKQALETLPKHKVIMSPAHYRFPHAVYNTKEVEEIPIYHKAPENLRDRMARAFITGLRGSFDFFTRFDENKMTETSWAKRCLMLESVAAMPEMVAGTIRHLHSLRRMRKDGGWIHHLVEEAENERMHLFFFLTLWKPNLWWKMIIKIGQVGFYPTFFLGYMISPKFCHRVVGYLEEEACHTYTILLKQMDLGLLPGWNKEAAEGARVYWDLPPKASIRDVILSIRADEAIHRCVNHHLSDIPKNAVMGFSPAEVKGYTKIDDNDKKIYPSEYDSQVCSCTWKKVGKEEKK